MDIYSFINSKDIEQHCRNLQHQFSLFESAYLIWESNRYALAEKHKAYQELIDTMPDEPISNIDAEIASTGCTSLHGFLKRYIELENRLLQMFYEDTPNTFYLNEILSYGSIIHSGRDSSPEGCIRNCKEVLSEEDEKSIGQVRIEKVYLNTKEKDDEKILRVSMLKDGSAIAKITYVARGCDFGFNDEEVELFSLFENHWFRIPIPFQEGDIVHIPGNYHPFIFLHIHNPPACVVEDREGMILFGYFQQWWDGAIYPLDTDSPDDGNYTYVEYYKEKLEGKERILQAINNFMKGEIPINVLLNAYVSLITEEATWNITQFGDYYRKLSGL